MPAFRSDFQSCGNEGECVDQSAAIARFKGLASVVPDLNWTIKELFVSGENTIVVRGEATGTPIKTLSRGRADRAKLPDHVY
jgi:hypothetical protein